MAQFDRAQQSRQQMARDIFHRLVLATRAGSGLPEYDAAVRWLAQLAVNIVDYIDTDDYSTPFEWVSAFVPGLSIKEINIQMEGRPYPRADEPSKP